jgi:hypothetical protein
MVSGPAAGGLVEPGGVVVCEQVGGTADGLELVADVACGLVRDGCCPFGGRAHFDGLRLLVAQKVGLIDAAEGQSRQANL